MLRSSSTLLLARTDYNMKTYGARAFAISAPGLWNHLPDDIKSIDNFTTFNQSLRPIFLSLSKINFYVNFILFIYFFFTTVWILCKAHRTTVYVLYKCLLLLLLLLLLSSLLLTVFLRSCCPPPLKNSQDKNEKSIERSLFLSTKL